MRGVPRLLKSLFLVLLLSLGTPVLAQSGSADTARGPSVSLPSAIKAPPASGNDDGTLSTAEYNSWGVVAQASEKLIDTDNVSDTTLAALRARLVKWRDLFQSAENANSAAIKSVQAQLDALGPEPKEGETEADSVAQQRKELQKRLDSLKEPSREAQVAYSQADSLIGSIDTIMRDRQTQALLEFGPSPLDPGNWPAAFKDLTHYLRNVVSETVTNWRTDQKQEVFRQNIPVVLLLLALAVVLLARGRNWIERLAARINDRGRNALRWLISFMVSLGQIALPIIGLALLVSAAVNTGIIGHSAMVLLEILPLAGVMLYVPRWVAGYIFPPQGEAGDAPLELSSAQRREGRVYAGVLGAVFFILIILTKAAHVGDWSTAGLNVMVFPLLVITALLQGRLARFLVIHGKSHSEDSEDHGFRKRLLHAFGRLVLVVSIAAPILAAIGYFKAGQALAFRTSLTLLMIGFLIVLQRLVEEIYVLLTRNRTGAREALLPVLLDFLLILLSLPLFALIWGAQPTDLSEMWTRFQAGFTVGDTHISPSDFMTFAVVFALGYMITRLLQGAVRTSVLPKTKLDIGGQNAVVSGLGYIGIFLAALLAITTAGIDLSSLAIVAGALSVGVGFGLQTIVQNFVSGIILLVERPISEGDWIEVGGQMGFVRNISVRSTRIETFDRTDVIVPNADLISGVVTNWTRGNLIGRLIIKVGVAYGCDTRHVQQVLQEIAEAQPLVVLNPPPGVIFMGFGASSLDFEMRMILRDVTQMLNVQTEVNHQIAERFADEGIEIPFSQHDIWLRNPETLRSSSAQSEGTKTPRAAPKDTTSEQAPPFMRDPDAESSPDLSGDGDGDADR